MPYRFAPGLEVLVAHPGGPLWARKDAGAWSIVKGVVDVDEEPRLAAAREFTEETGWPPPPEPWIELGAVRLKSGKTILGWAVEGEYDPGSLTPEYVTMEIRGRPVRIPEIDRVEWFDLATARTKLNPAYGPFLDKLERLVARAG